MGKDGQEILQKIPGLTSYGKTENKGAVISFNLGNIHPHDVAHILDTSGIAIRAGPNCAQPVMTHLNVSATNRVSFYFYNTFSEIEKLCECLIKINDMFS